LSTPLHNHQHHTEREERRDAFESGATAAAFCEAWDDREESHQWRPPENPDEKLNHA
jgi:hypothetical protein